ncbi:MAG TPA: PAS domain S-box protein [Verrucomicrobiae bacterium]|jgi:PAS domain S-box-containing protein
MMAEFMTSVYEVSLGTACLFLLTTLMWSLLLRRKVNEQTAEIRRQYLREQELQNRYKDLFENANDLVFSLNEAGCFTTLNKAGEGILGLTRQHAASVCLRELVAPGFFELFDVWMDNLTKDKVPSRCELEMVGKHHKSVALEISARPIFENEQLARIEGIARDISQRKKAEMALKESEERFSSAFRVSPVAIAIKTQAEERFQDANESFLRMFEMEPAELIDKTSDELGLWANVEEHQKVKRLLQDNKSVGGMECSFKTKTGKLRTALVFMEVLKMGDTPCVLFIVHDLTERQTLEGHLRQSQKLEAVGRLAAGVAHDFNNLLTVIQGNIELLRLKKQVTPEIDRPLSQVSDAAEKASGLVKQLLTFSKKQVLQPKLVDVNEVIANCTKVISHLLPSNISLKYHFAAGLPRIKADVTMLEQILLNLSVNARDAMDKGGELSISTMQLELDAGFAASFSNGRPGRFLCLSVSDTGCGMDVATQARIFEPFFTTKSPDKGTGLGLATVYGSVQQHNGWIELKSEVGKGTAFNIYLPCEKVSGQTDAFQKKKCEKENPTVLVVEDDTNVLEFVRMALESGGYRVVEAVDALQALEQWNQRKDEIDVLFTDMKIPKGMSGAELAENLRALKPCLRVIYTSGFSPDLFARNLRLEEGLNYLPKPYPTPRLLETVRQCLEHESSVGLN